MKSQFKKVKLSSFKYDEIKYKNDPEYKKLYFTNVWRPI